nr:MAG TPA: hypothetical protein [Bacteriophage sp.]
MAGFRELLLRAIISTPFCGWLPRPPRLERFRPLPEVIIGWVEVGSPSVLYLGGKEV